MEELIGIIAQFGTDPNVSHMRKSAHLKLSSVLHFGLIAECIASSLKSAPFALDATRALWTPLSIAFGVVRPMPIFPMTQLFQLKSILLWLKHFFKNLLFSGAEVLYL